MFVPTHLHPPRLDPRFVAELDQSHEHGQAQPTNQDVEHAGHVAQTERARFVLSARRSRVRLMTSLWFELYCKQEKEKDLKASKPQSSMRLSDYEELQSEAVIPRQPEGQARAGTPDTYLITVTFG